MPVLRDDLDLERGGRRRANRSGWGLFALVFLAISLLVLSRLEHPVVRDLRTSVTELLAPVLSTLARWSEPMATRIGASSDARRLISENEHLRERVARLEGWEARARELQRRLDDLAPMVRMVPEAGYTFLTMRVVGEPRGPFSRTALVGAGTAQGLRKGYAVVDGGGLVGRIVAVSSRAARILLLTDPASRVPVTVGPQQVPAIVQGDTSGTLTLSMVASLERLSDGAEVVTSGASGMLPSGLRVGRLALSGGRARVQPHARLGRLSYVSVLFYSGPSMETGEAGGHERQPPSREGGGPSVAGRRP
ncbi:MAG: rod shape-determining protein MreC [Hyphomicrobiaceae bacterium]